MKLLSKSIKTEKSDNAGKGYLTAIMYFAPHKLSGHNVCPHASKGCSAGCLNLSGRGYYSRIQKARLAKTRFYFEHRAEFKAQLYADIAEFVRKCERNNKKPAIRLNGTSDIPWERIFPDMFGTFPMVQFYDYTKNAKRYWQFLTGYGIT